MIFFIREKTSGGGAERYLQRLSIDLKKREIEYSIIYAKIPKFFPSWLKILIFNRDVCKKKKPSSLYFSLDRITCPDIYRAGDGVHKAFLKVKGLSFNPLHLVYLWLERRTFQNSKIIIANSHMVKEQIIHYYKIDPNKIKVIYNGVPIPRNFDKAQAKHSLATRFDLDEKLPLILFVGSGFKRKGVEEFLKILSRLETPFHAFIIGKERKISHYISLAKKLHLQNRVTFTGAQKDVESFYAASDIFLFPTRYEPFSNVVLEAMSYGCATFTTKENGACEILDSSFIMETSDDFSIGERIEELLTNPKKLTKAQKGARAIAQNFSIEKNVEQTLDVIQEFYTLR